MAEPAKQRKRPKVEAVPDPAPSSEARGDDATGAGSPSGIPDAAEGAAAGARPGVCPVAWCPVCLAVTAVQPLRPDAVEHLLKAGTEFFLAMRSLVDARADEVDPAARGAADGDWEKIDIG